jgi:hypothetical protein
MNPRAVLGVLGGVPPLLVWLALGPSPAEDPGGWGPCGFRSVFPVRDPQPVTALDYCFHCSECVVNGPRAAMAALFFAAISMVSGAFTIFVARTPRYALGGLAPLLLLPIVLSVMAWNQTFNVYKTIGLGAAIVTGSVLAAIAGGYVAARKA